MNVRRALVVLILPALVLTAIVLPILLLGDRLPATIATHWSTGGPDGSSDGTTAAIVTVGLWLLAWVALLVTGRRPQRLFYAPWLLGLGGLLAGSTGATIAANLDAADWRQADHLSALGVLGPLVLAGLLVVLGERLERGRPVNRRPDSDGTTDARPTVDLSPEERAVWTGRAVATPWLIALTGGIALVLGLLGFVGPGPKLPLLAVGVVLLVVAVAVGSTRVTVSERGVVARLGLPWPRRQIALDTIADARAIEVEPLKWGGWGWRMLPGATALVVRRGEGLLLDLHDGRRFVVTVDDAATAAGLVCDLLARAPSEAADA